MNLNKLVFNSIPITQRYLVFIANSEILARELAQQRMYMVNIESAKHQYVDTDILNRQVS